MKIGRVETVTAYLIEPRIIKNVQVHMFIYLNYKFLISSPEQQIKILCYIKFDNSFVYLFHCHFIHYQKFGRCLRHSM